MTFKFQCMYAEKEEEKKIPNNKELNFGGSCLFCSYSSLFSFPLPPRHSEPFEG